MPSSASTGTRIRERRIELGLKQAAVAATCEISPSYLNLIEHNRRRIGGRLLVAISNALGVDPAQLSQGAETELVEDLRLAAVQSGTPDAETTRTEEFAARYPGWAGLVREQFRRIGTLERVVEALDDRLTHDPHLSTSLHDMVSTVTAIRSTSAILANEPDIDPDWLLRFHRNVYEDSQRLAEASHALISYLDAGGDASRIVATPQDEVEAWLDTKEWHLDDLETGEPDYAGLDDVGELTLDASRMQASLVMHMYRATARAMPLDATLDMLAEIGPDPGALAQKFGTDLLTVFKRLAFLPQGALKDPVGLALCDGSGTLTLKKQIPGFLLPRYGAACALLPIYQALGRPMTPLRARIEQTGHAPTRFLTYAIAVPRPSDFDAPPVVEAAMLFHPEPPGYIGNSAPLGVGTSCRICPRRACPARREPSILPEDAGSSASSGQPTVRAG
ncbi:MAG: helix-turn-helix domain-containing protein [Pseudomonadota bacterium]